MDQTAPDSKSTALSWWSLWNPDSWIARAGALAPQNLVQPILPGWSFGSVTINERNSSAPDIEREILAENSYGRQLGKVMDAVVALIDERAGKPGDDPRYSDLLDLEMEIEGIKARCASSRVKRLEAELEKLRTESPEDYQRIAAAMAVGPNSG
jgi:hypothetical protein